MSIVTDLLDEIKKLKGKDLTAFKAGMSKVLGTSGVSANPFSSVAGIPDDMEKRNQTRLELLRSIGVASTDLIDQFQDVEEASRSLFGTTAEGMQTLNELGSSMQSFSFFTAEASAKLVDAAMTMKAFGVNTDTMAGIMDTATLSFGANQEELTRLTAQLGGIVSKFPGQASQIAENFRNAQQSLLYDSTKIMDVFKRLQATSSQTGVSFSSLTQAFGESMDTFQGSSEKAGRLNAILGKSVFNSIDLLGKSEADRVETIIAGVKKNVNVEALKQNKFQLKAVADGLGLTPDETRRLLSGKATVEEVMKGKEDPRTKAQRLTTEALQDNTTSIEDLKKSFDAFRPESTRFLVEMQSQTQMALTNEIKALFGVTDTSVKNLTTLTERVVAAGTRAGFNPETQKKLLSVMSKISAGAVNLDKEAISAALKSQDLTSILDKLRNEMKLTRGEQQDIDRRRAALGMEDQPRQTAANLVKGTAQAIRKVISNLVPIGGFKDQPRGDTSDLSGVTVETKKNTKELDKLNKNLSSGLSITINTPMGQMQGTMQTKNESTDILNKKLKLGETYGK